MMSKHDGSSRRWYLVNYDIRDPKRWRQAYKMLKGFGERIQYSLFRCRLARAEIESLRWELKKVLEEEDDLLIVYLCPTCAARIKQRDGEDEEGWQPPKEKFDIL